MEMSKAWSWGISGHNRTYKAYPEAYYKEQIRLAAELGSKIYCFNYCPVTEDEFAYLDRMVAEVQAQGMDVMLITDNYSLSPEEDAALVGPIAARYTKDSPHGFIRYFRIFGEQDCGALCESFPKDTPIGQEREHFTPEILDRWYQKMKAAIDVAGIEVKELPCRYPQGAEKVLIENCTGREVPFPGLPSDVGVIVMNVTSVAFVSKYLETGMPLTTKRLTVDGDIVKEPKNVEVLIGTPIQELLDFCGGLTAQPGKVLYGGPMMGTCVADLSQPILKNNNAVLAFSEKLARLPKKTNCIHCGRCVNACPLGLAAKDIVKAYENGNVELLQELNADLCMSCGTCSFVCPAKRPLAPSIALAKIMMKNGGKK